MRSHKQEDLGVEAYARPIPDILSQIKDSYRELRRAERRVADVVLADVTFSVDASNAEIARRAEVSEPTVTRFCRAIGCDGVRDFKLKLAQSVVVGRLYLAPAPPPEPNGNGSPLWNVVLGEARNALNAVERSIDPRDIIEGHRVGGERPSGSGFRSGRQLHGVGAGNAEPAVPLRRCRLRPFRPLCHEDDGLDAEAQRRGDRDLGHRPHPRGGGGGGRWPSTIGPRPSASRRPTPILLRWSMLLSPSTCRSFQIR